MLFRGSVCDRGMFCSTSLEPSTVINMCDKLDVELINMLEKKILETHPNTYTFTKNLAEQIVASDSKGLPVAIVRPSIIGASLEEPCPGWLENIFGVTSISIDLNDNNLFDALCISRN